MGVANMPRGDRTGPLGQGPRTGRRMGFCSGYNSPGFTRGTPRGGAGFGQGYGRGFGWRNWQQQEPLTLNKDEQIKILKQERNSIEAELKEIEQKLQELNK